MRRARSRGGDSRSLGSIHPQGWRPDRMVRPRIGRPDEYQSWRAAFGRIPTPATGEAAGVRPGDGRTRMSRGPNSAVPLGEHAWLPGPAHGDGPTRPRPGRRARERVRVHARERATPVPPDFDDRLLEGTLWPASS